MNQLIHEFASWFLNSPPFFFVTSCKTHGPLFLLRERPEVLRTVPRMIVNDLAALHERRGHRPRFSVGALDRLSTVLGKIDAAHAIRRVRSAAMENVARERHDAARRHDHGIARILAKITNEIVRTLFLLVVDD